ncbi:sensor histidine kinase [Breznakiella homolactica]|uniref:histidine kinase n=1 Tax=Breznakiella homolactica TaxID=2798577 RepID=A0A7T7XLY4_9SPIR|nr:ATP-binding protein [Breznakiella homolactica]QQO08632.1 PAS domain-containing protein [Breznakiella homolactica]
MTDLIEIINALSGQETVSVDSGLMRVLLAAVLILALVAAAVLAGLAALLVNKKRRPLPVWKRETANLEAELRRQLNDLTARVNNWNNYINSIFSSIEDGFFLVDKDNQVVLFNGRAKELLNLGPEIFFSKSSNHLNAAEPLSAILDSCRKVTASKAAEQLCLETPDGRKLEVRVGPIIDKYRTGTDFGSLAIIKDVTELLKLENLKKDFVASVSHEFRTPLTLISGFIEMFRMGNTMQPEESTRAFEIMDIETERLKRLISELLSLSEIGHELPGDPDGTVDVTLVLRGIAQTLGVLAEQKGQSFIAEINPEPMLLPGNENWFYLAVKNVVENAIKYTPSEGTIRIRAVNTGTVFSIDIEDTGIGIEPEELEHIFNRFYRVEKARGSASGGSGLGLALVKDIVSLFRGEITVRSTPGKGTLFSITIPVSREI